MTLFEQPDPLPIPNPHSPIPSLKGSQVVRVATARKIASVGGVGFAGMAYRLEFAGIRERIEFVAENY